MPCLSLRTYLFLLILVSLQGCTFSRMIWYNFSDITDYKIFPSRPLEKSEAPFYFHQRTSTSTRINQLDTDSLTKLLEETPTVAFLVIRNDTLLYEKYFQDYTDSSIVASFSTGKSYVSALVGIAVDEGYIKSVQEPITKYIPELKDNGDFEKITIEHLLQMTSGIKSKEKYYSPFSHVARLYYGKNLRRLLKNLKIAYPPGEKFEYISLNTQLLGLILERATQQTMTNYLQEKIWTPLGMEYDASWSIDRKKNGLEKAFCCLNARAIDYAKFGRLYLKKGNWQGKQIISEAWIEKTTDVTDTTRGNTWYQQYQWWFTSKKGNFTTNGLHGQFIFVHPQKNIIIVRLGKRSGKNIKWYKVFEATAAKL